MENFKDKQNWIDAMKSEMNSLMKNKTWSIVEPPPNRRIIGCKWTYKLKRDNTGKKNIYKARLVAKGYSQKFGEDYDETYAPVVSYTTIRALLIAALHQNLNVKHIDINTAFLHGELEEEV